MRPKGSDGGSGLDRHKFAPCDSRVQRDSEVRRIGSSPTRGLVHESWWAGSPKGESMNTILNRHRLVWPAARIPQQLPDDFALATPVRGDVTAAQPVASLPPKSALWSALSPASSQAAVWRPSWRLHNRERARYENPLISANPHFSVRLFATDGTARGADCRGFLPSSEGAAGLLDQCDPVLARVVGRADLDAAVIAHRGVAGLQRFRFAGM